jgi:hypothetical protein
MTDSWQLIKKGKMKGKVVPVAKNYAMIAYKNKALFLHQTASVV